MSEQWPRVVLTADNWDDFGYKTTFHMKVFLEDRDVDLEIVKVLKRDAQTTILPASFDALPEQFASLGQEFTYYESLHRLGPDVYEPILRGLRDVVYFPDIHASFRNEPGFSTSLLRFSGAQSALEIAPSLFRTSPTERLAGPVVLHAETSVGGDSFEVMFEWLSQDDLPGHIVAIIGYNGTGKTQLLANLAFIASETGLSDDRTSDIRGRVIDNSLGTFAGVIGVSFSAFDTFALPRPTSTVQTSQLGTFFGYSYIGLRRAYSTDESDVELKTPLELARDFVADLHRAHDKERIEGVRSTLEILSQEPSFARSGFSVDEIMGSESAHQEFSRLSTGHKVVLNILVGLAARLQPRTLVLVDEPESHLHPPLVAALLAALGDVLKKYESVAIVATHSPVVLQELPSHQVRVLSRFGAVTRIDPVEIETFGENLGHITRTVFNLDSSATDYQDVLRRLAQEYTAEQVNTLFPQGLSRQARALFASFRANLEDDA